MYISNKSTNRFSRPFTPALNNIRFGPSKTPTASSRLGPTAPTTGPLGTQSNVAGLSNTKIGEGWKNIGSKYTPEQQSQIMGGKTPSGPIQSLSQPTAPAPQRSGTTNYTAPVTTSSTPTTPVGATTNVGSTPSPSPIKGMVTPPAKATDSLYGGLVKDIRGMSKASNEQKRLQQRLEQEAQANKAIGEQARQLSEQYGKEIAQVGKLGAGAVAGNLSTGSNIVGSGNAAIASQSASQRMQALSQAQNAALAGTGQQLTGQSQTQTGLTSALGSANTQQQLGLSGLGTAAGYAQPQVAAYGQTVFDPTTGQYSGGNLDPQTQATNLAQQVMSGAMTYDQALASLGYAGSAGANFLNNAITGAGGNPLQLQATGNVQQANITTTGTLGTNIAAAGLGNITPQYVQTEANVNAAKEQAGRALNILQQTGLNNVSSTDFNKAANELRSRMGDPNFAAFQTAINEAKNFYTSVLAGSGSTPSGNEEIASQIAALNTNSPISAIVASLKELEFASSTRLQSLSSQQGQYNANLGGGGYSGGGGGFAEAW